MRIMSINHKKERLALLLHLTEKFGGELAVQFLTPSIVHLRTVATIPECLRPRRYHMLGLTQYTGHESIRLQSLGQGRYIRLDLGKTKSTAVMGIPPGHPDRTGGHTNRNRYMTVLKTQTLFSEFVNIRSGSLYLGTINSHGVAVHVIQGNEHDIQFWLSIDD